MLLFPATAHGSRGVTEHGERGGGRRRAHFLRARMPGRQAGRQAGRHLPENFSGTCIILFNFPPKRAERVKFDATEPLAKLASRPRARVAHFSGFAGLLVVGVSAWCARSA